MKAPRVWPSLLGLLILLTAGSAFLKNRLATLEPVSVRETFNKAFVLRTAPLLFLHHRIAASQFFQLEAILTILKLEFPHYHLAGEEEHPHAHEHHHSATLSESEEEPIVAWSHGPDGRDIPLTRSQLEALQKREQELTLHTERYLDIEYFFDLIEVAALLDPQNSFILDYGQSWVLNPRMAREMVRVLDTVYNQTRHWRPAFDAGWLLLFTLREPQEATDRFQKALTDPRAPAFVRDVLARSLMADRKYEIAAQLLQSRLAATSDHEIATRLERQLAWTLDLLLLNKAAQVYQNRHGSPIASLDDLVQDGILREIPPDKMGQGYDWDPERQEVYSRQIFRPPSPGEESTGQEKTTRSNNR